MPHNRNQDHVQRTRRLLGLAFAASLGGLGLWYLRRRLTVPVNAVEYEVVAAQAMPLPIPQDAAYGDVPPQLLTDGHGPLYVRSYQVDIAHPTLSREALMQHLTEDLNRCTPQEMAHFTKTKGEPDRMAVGDEYFIYIAGPWNGPVRVINVTPTSFAFVTLAGHLEAGEITFSVLEHPERQDTIRFRIQSWARSSNRVTDLFYRVLGISQFAQTTMWVTFCKQVVAESGGERLGKIQVTTHKVDEKYILQQMPRWKPYASRFEQWRRANLNFDINQTEQFTESNGWRIDDYSTGLPGEAPGAPEPNGSFAAAKDIVLNYEFPDPSLISGVFLPDDPLNERIMILRAHFLLFNFLFGVRIGNVIDEVRQTEKQGPAYVWGYSYRTLEGHFEMGEITFEVWKYAQTGEVRFRVHAYSKPDRIKNPFYRIGFRIFGRSLQMRFARASMARMQQLVLERLAAPVQPRKPLETPEVQPIAASEAAQEKVDQVQQETSQSS